MQDVDIETLHNVNYSRLLLDPYAWLVLRLGVDFWCERY